MKQLTFSALALALLLTTATAQKASFTSYTKPCNNAQALQITGLPKLGTTFTVNLGFMLCTRKFCGCNIGPCNTCRGSVLVFGIKKINAPVGVCNLHVDPILILGGASSIAFKVPNIPRFIGVKFLLQRGDVAMIEMIDKNCKTSFPVSSVNAMSDAVEFTVGI